MACRASLIIFASCAATINAACFSLQSHIPDSYCEDNCNQPDTPFCPEEFCSCGGTAPQFSTVTCTSPLSFLGINAWCTELCNHVPSICPPVLCSCIDSETGDSNDLAQPLNCLSKSAPVTNEWCNANCGIYCPFKYCDCGYPVLNYVSECESVTDAFCVETCNTLGTDCHACCVEAEPTPVPEPSPDPVSLFILGDDVDACCSLNGHNIYIASNGAVYRGQIFPDNDFSFDFANAVLCAETSNAVSIAVDSDGGAYVADSGAGQLIYVDPSCNPLANVIITDKASSDIKTPTSVTIFDDNLIVSTLERGFFGVALSETHQVIGVSLIDSGSRQINQVKTYNGELYFLFSSFFVSFLNGGLIQDIINAQEIVAAAIVDISVSNCGLYLLSTGGEVVQCSDPQDGSTCQSLCGSTFSTCSTLQTPTSISVDCNCNVYIGNTGGGTITAIDGLNSTVINSNMYFPGSLSVYSDSC